MGVLIPEKDELEKMERIYKTEVSWRFRTLNEEFDEKINRMNEGREFDRYSLVKITFHKNSMTKMLEKLKLLRSEEAEVLEFYRIKSGEFEVIFGPISDYREAEVLW